MHHIHVTHFSVGGGVKINATGMVLGPWGASIGINVGWKKCSLSQCADTEVQNRNICRVSKTAAVGATQGGNGNADAARDREKRRMKYKQRS